MKIILDSVQDAFNFVVDCGNIDVARSFWTHCSDINSQDYLAGALQQVKKLKKHPSLRINLPDISKGDYNIFQTLVIPFGGSISDAYIERFSSLGGQQYPIFHGDKFLNVLGELEQEKVLFIAESITLRNKQIDQIKGL